MEKDGLRNGHPRPLGLIDTFTSFTLYESSKKILGRAVGVIMGYNYHFPNDMIECRLEVSNVYKRDIVAKEAWLFVH